jgi:hypothetical protein
MPRRRFFGFSGLLFAMALSTGGQGIRSNSRTSGEISLFQGLISKIYGSLVRN